jgi:hypothetical protein
MKRYAIAVVVLMLACGCATPSSSPPIGRSDAQHRTAKWSRPDGLHHRYGNRSGMVRPTQSRAILGAKGSDDTTVMLAQQNATVPNGSSENRPVSQSRHYQSEVPARFRPYRVALFDLPETSTSNPVISQRSTRVTVTSVEIRTSESWTSSLCQLWPRCHPASFAAAFAGCRGARGAASPSRR